MGCYTTGDTNLAGDGLIAAVETTHRPFSVGSISGNSRKMVLYEIPL